MTAGGGAPPPGSSNSIVVGRYDFNGDGKDDITYWNGASWSVALSTNAGFSSPYTLGITAGIRVDRFLPNGRAAILAVGGGGLWTYRWDDASSSFVSNYTGIASAALPTAVIDFNGDKMMDLVYYSGGTAIQVRMNISSGSGNPSFGTLVPTAQLTANQQYAGFQALRTATYANSDVNGDGRNDIRVQIVFTGMGGGAIYTTYLYGSSVGFDVPAFAQWTPGTPPVESTLNFNGDRCADKQIATFGISISSCATTAGPGVPLPAVPKAYLDWDGDGKMDLAVDNGGTLGIYRSTGVGLASLLTTSIPSAGNFFAMDQDGDGLDDLIKINGTSALSYWTHTSSGVVPAFATNVPDLLSGVTDGFGITHTPNYVSTAAGSYDKGAATNAPLQESKPLIVVAQVTQSNGIGTTFNRSYFYVGARSHATRDSFAGFQRIDETDSRNSIITRAYFEQTFPITGMLSQLEVMQPNGVTPILRVVYTNGFANLDTTGWANNQRYFTYAQGATAAQFEVGGIWNGSQLLSVSTANTYDNASGTLYDQTVTTTELASGNGVSGGAVWTARTYSPTLVNDLGNWCMGRPSRTQQINSHNLAYGSSITRTTDVAWSNTHCRPTQAVDETGNPNLQVTTAFGYDIFGNVSSTTVTGIGMAVREVISVYADATYTTGQFPLSVENALDQVSTMAWDYDRGVPATATDPNGISTSWQYDAFARRIRENNADGTYTTWDIAPCPTCDPLIGTQLTMQRFTSAGVSFAADQVLLDKLDRPLYEFSRRMDGNYNSTARVYDGLGRVEREYFPYLSTASPGAFATFQYDLLNRLVQTSRPISDATATLQDSYIYYEGLKTRTVDAQSKQSVKFVNAVGALARSADHDGYYQAFDYDAFGSLKRVLDSAGNTLQSSQYNLRGMLTSRTDMNMGTWNFIPNALGEVISQTDAKSQVTTFDFDKLGRLISRYNVAEGTDTFTWGTAAHNSATEKYIGGLKSISGPGYSEIYTNDFLGRLSVKAVSADANYSIGYTYNDIGALDTLKYPVSTGAMPLMIKHLYQNGALHRIQECTNLACTTTGTNYWTATGFNARNQLTQETLGNNLQTNRNFDVVTGWTKNIRTGLSGGSGTQNLEYEWDLVGNLKKRRDLNQSSLTEEFFYDNLYRVASSKLNSVDNLLMSYDSLGNIASKSDVGGYAYHASKKHQITAAGSWNFAYDNNGNMTSGRAANITWTSYNYPLCITYGPNCSGNSYDYSQFSYTPSRRYWKQVSNYTPSGFATTIYVAGLLEKVTSDGADDYRHYIRAGGSTIIVSRRTAGPNPNNTRYVTSDHLGSSSAITDNSGGTLVNLSFDAFGKRRGSAWTGAPTGGVGGDWEFIAKTTRRGYTDHSMLDNLGLIHMNGRVQDPVLGRFASADPYVPNTGFSQSFNRYSYVTNKPLSFTDPSGFLDEPKTLPPIKVPDPWPPRAPIDELGASRPEGGRSGPCTDQFGFTFVTTFHCFLVTAQIGMGSAHADSAAERHRRLTDRIRGRPVRSSNNGGLVKFVRSKLCSAPAGTLGVDGQVDLQFGFTGVTGKAGARVTSHGQLIVSYSSGESVGPGIAAIASVSPSVGYQRGIRAPISGHQRGAEI